MEEFERVIGYEAESLHVKIKIPEQSWKYFFFYFEYNNKIFKLIFFIIFLFVYVSTF